jgi:hypothetical protein
MTLREYMFRMRLNIKSFAREIGYSRNHLSMAIHGRTPLATKLIKAIVKGTSGLVKYEDMLEEISENIRVQKKMDDDKQP